MADEDDTKYCSNCKRDIATANFVMHEVHCLRNIVLCGHCEEPVPRSELDDHFEEFHALVNCDLCGQSVERAALDTHKEDDCLKRMKQCCFCELEVAFDALQDHQEVCGSRTELCPRCSKYIMLKDQGRHDDTNCTYPIPRSTNNHNSHRTVDDNEFFMQLTAADYRIHHDMGRIHTGDWGATWSSDPVRNATGADLYQRSMNRLKRAPTNAERSHTNTHTRGINHTSTRPSRLISNGDLRQNVQTLNASDFQHEVPLVPVVNGDLRRDVARASDTNEFLPLVPVANGELQRDIPQDSDVSEFFPLEPVANGELRRNIAEAPRIEVNNNTRRAQDLRNPNLFSAGSDLHSEMTPTWPEGATDVIESEDLTYLPCEFCGESYPADSLILHQGICSSQDTDPSSPTHIPWDVEDTLQQSDLPRNQPAFGVFGDLVPRVLTNNRLPHSDIAANRRSLLFEDNLSRSTDTRRLSHDRSYGVSHDLSRDASPDMEIPMLPCEFCDVLLPADMLIQHQATCLAEGLDSPRPMDERRSLEASDRRPQQPHRQPDPIIVDIHAHRKQETGYPRNDRKKNAPQQKKSGVLGPNNGSEEASHVAPRWRNQRPLQSGGDVSHVAPRWRNQRPPQSGGDVSHVAPKWRNQRPPNSEREDFPPSDPRWRGPKSQGKCSLPAGVRDLMPKLATAARNPVGNRTSQGNNRGGAGGARRRQGGRGGNQRGAERSQGGGDRSQGGGERHQGGGERHQGGGERHQGGGERRSGGAVADEESLRHVITEEAAVGVPMTPSLSPADDLEDSDTTFVKSVDDDETEAAGWSERSRGHEDDGPSSILQDINATPLYEASFAERGPSRGRRTGGGPTNSQRPTKSVSRGGTPSGGRERNRNRRGGHAGSRRMPQGDV